MFGSAVLETAIGVIFVFLLVSLVGSGVSSWISDKFEWRAEHLEKSIRDLILGGDQTLVDTFYNSQVVKALAPPGKKPINIPARTFILALFDAFVPGASGKTSVEELHDHFAVTLSDASPLKAPLLSFFNKAETTVNGARKNAETWFNVTENWMSKTYHDKIMVVTLIISLVIGIFFNVDSISVISGLWHDPTLRSSVAAAANQYAEQSAQSTNDKDKQANAQKAIEELNKLNLPIGWQLTTSPSFSLIPSDWAQAAQPPTIVNHLTKLLGWLITALAGAQGAPFWFDLLRKLTQKNA